MGVAPICVAGFCIDIRGIDLLPMRAVPHLAEEAGPSALPKTHVNFHSASGAVLTVPAKLKTYSFGEWSVSASQPLARQIPPLFRGTGTAATITFKVVTAVLAGTVNIDSVMIDPYRRG